MSHFAAFAAGVFVAFGAAESGMEAAAAAFFAVAAFVAAEEVAHGAGRVAVS